MSSSQIPRCQSFDNAATRRPSGENIDVKTDRDSPRKLSIPAPVPAPKHSRCQDSRTRRGSPRRVACRQVKRTGRSHNCRLVREQELSRGDVPKLDKTASRGRQRHPVGAESQSQDFRRARRTMADAPAVFNRMSQTMTPPPSSPAANSQVLPGGFGPARRTGSRPKTRQLILFGQPSRSRSVRPWARTRR